MQAFISNCVKLPFPKGLFPAARALTLIGQIVFGFETQTVINETTVNEFGPRWLLHLSSPADTESTRSCSVILATVLSLGKLADKAEKDGFLILSLLSFILYKEKISPKRKISGNMGRGWQKMETS